MKDEDAAVEKGGAEGEGVAKGEGAAKDPRVVALVKMLQATRVV